MAKKILLILILFSLGCSEYPEVLDSGIFDRVEYKMGAFNSSDLTIIYWQDGRTYIFKKRLSIPMSSGKKYQIIDPGCFKDWQFIEKKEVK